MDDYFWSWGMENLEVIENIYLLIQCYEISGVAAFFFFQSPGQVVKATLAFIFLGILNNFSSHSSKFSVNLAS